MAATGFGVDRSAACKATGWVLVWLNTEAPSLISLVWALHLFTANNSRMIPSITYSFFKQNNHKFKELYGDRKGENFFFFQPGRSV